ncbi:MAG: hypothetical protein P8013_08875 [Candidatus Sulfobium sp.]
MLSLLYKPLVVACLLLGLFGLIWLRSRIVAVNYEIHNLEEKKMDALTDMKLLLADRAKLMSLAKIDTSLQRTATDKRYAGGGYVFPDRVKVVHVKRSKGLAPYNVAFKRAQ